MPNLNWRKLSILGGIGLFALAAIILLIRSLLPSVEYSEALGRYQAAQDVEKLAVQGFDEAAQRVVTAKRETADALSQLMIIRK